MVDGAWLKLIGAAITLLLSVICGFLARHRYFARNPTVLGLANTAGGGVILAVTFSHLVPEVVEGFSEYSYPIGFLIILAGYTLLIILEKVLFAHAHMDQHHNGEEEPLRTANDPIPLQERQENFITPLLLLIALCVHSLLEGLVFGLQKVNNGALSVMIAIISHKPIESLLLGIVMVREYVSLHRHVVMITIMSVVTPVGICIGIGLNNFEISDDYIATFNALAAGTFLYISTTEIIGEEFSAAKTRRERFAKLFAFIFGMAFIFIMRIWLGHEEHGDDDHDHDH